ncbi:MAG: hypothetical protein ACE5E9_13630 [Nitrospinaceae bacterium]
MGIIRGGDSEYEAQVPSFEQKTKKLEETIRSALQTDSTVLQLKGRYFATDEMTVISGSEQVRSVKSLDLSDNQINDEGLGILFESPNLAGLEELYLGINFVTDRGILGLAQSTRLAMTHLKVLSLSDNKLTDASLSELVRSPNFNCLEFLDIGWNEVGNGTAQALGETNTLANLKKLDLERGYIDSEGVNHLVRGRVIEHLEELNLSANKLNDEAVQILANTPKLSSLRVLRLSQNLFGDEGAKALGASATLTGLTHLYMGRNLFGPEGAKAVFETKTLTRLKTLMLQEGVETTPGLVNYSRPELLRPGHE